MSDTRIAYGTTCLWWDSVHKAGNTATHPFHLAHNRQLRSDAPRLSGALGRGLPCCPNCGGMLYEMPDEATFMRGAEDFERAGHPGYMAFLRWQRGKCFQSMEAAAEAYRLEGGDYTHIPEAV